VEHWQKRVGNGAKTATLADGTYVLTLPSGLLIQLENYYYLPIINRNIIFVSYLVKFGFSFLIKDKCCYIYLDNIIYVNAIMSNDISRSPAKEYYPN
jgi:hypothetical protein